MSRENTINVTINGGPALRVHGKLPTARLFEIAVAASGDDWELGPPMHTRLDLLQVRGAFEPGSSDTQWTGFDYANQAWITLEVLS